MPKPSTQPLLSIITPTHDPKWLDETWQSLRAQTCAGFEWVVCAHGDAALIKAVRAKVRGYKDNRIRVEQITTPGRAIGAVKREAFMHGHGELLVELDHDDLLTDDALTTLAKAAHDHPHAGFFYSDCADFDSGTAMGQGLPMTYMTNMRAGWEANGFKFYQQAVAGGGSRSGVFTCVRAFEPSARSISQIYWAPNHLRAWRRTTYRALGGHNPTFDLCDDHELLIRTYLHTYMHHITWPLYLYRVSGENTWAKQAPRIAALTAELAAKNTEKLVLREAQMRTLPVYDLGGAFGCPPGWTSVDQHNAHVITDLSKPWPWADSSVFAFRAHDFLEHIFDKQHVMREIHRCLVPGGWLLSSTPSTDGRGAFQDPTHISYWNQNSFWYWTRREQAAYIHNTDVCFQVSRLFTHMPSDWHKEHDISYVAADLLALKDGYEPVGESLI